jgi:ankyrin repeat protein
MSGYKPRELCNALVGLLENESDYVAEKVKVLTSKYSEKDLQEAVLKTKYVSRGMGWKGSLLHCACKHGAPLEVIEMLLDIDTKKRTILEIDDYGRLPIHWACYSKAPIEVIQLLLDSDTEKRTMKQRTVDSSSGLLPIHYACLAGASAEVIQLLLDSDTDKKTILVKGKRGRLPIHYACFTGATVEVIQLLLDSDTDKRTILEKDDSWRRLPIHMACSEGAATVEVIQLLLDSDTDKKSILEKDSYGYLPIHNACCNNAPAEVIQLLLDSDTDNRTIHEKADGALLPIDCACCYNANAEVIRLLLKASICDRMEHLGLDKWRMDVAGLIDSMTKEDSKRVKVQEIFERLSKYEEMERISLLELAVWRESCLNGDGISKFDSMQAVEDLGVADRETFDPVEYKRERRIKSGVDAIICGVLPFLKAG